jgi:hypothetical protein
VILTLPGYQYWVLNWLSKSWGSNSWGTIGQNFPAELFLTKLARFLSDGQLIRRLDSLALNQERDETGDSNNFKCDRNASKV